MEQKKQSPRKIVYTEGWNHKNEKSSFWQRFREVKTEGLLLQSSLRFIEGKFNKASWKIISSIIKLKNAVSKQCFQVGDLKFQYFINDYNAVNTERVVEVSIVKHFLDESEGLETLEVGNVTGHYFPIKHDVIDKYEIAEGVINSDAATFVTTKKYDLIISISTVEHIGYDEVVKDDAKLLRTLENLSQMLKEKGKFIITVPLTYNPIMDKVVYQKLFPFTSYHFLKRISVLNKWRETTLEDALLSEYNSQFPAANSIALLVFQHE